MKMILKVAIILAVAGLAVLILGLLLPKERVVTRDGHFDVRPAMLYRIVTDNTEWHYRSGLKDLLIVESADGAEVWDEYREDGSVIRFRTREKKPGEYYAFDMESKLFTGHWTGTFEPAGGGTLFTATEYIRIKNPFVRTLSYLFFNIGRQMETYQQDLHKKVSEGAEVPGGIVLTLSETKLPAGTTEIGLRVTNHTGEEASTGEYYDLYRKTGQEWEKIRLELFFNDIAYILQPGGSRDFTIGLHPDQYPYPPGEYRVGKRVNGKELFARFTLTP